MSLFYVAAQLSANSPEEKNAYDDGNSQKN